MSASDSTGFLRSILGTLRRHPQFFALAVSILVAGLAGAFLVAADPSHLADDLAAALDFFVSPWMISSAALVVALIAFGVWQLRTIPKSPGNPSDVAALLRVQRRRLIYAFSLFIAGILLVGGLYSHDLRETALDEGKTQVSGVARLKAQQVDKWLYERSLDAELLGNALQALPLDRWREDGQARDVIELLLADALAAHVERVAVALFDGRGSQLAAVGEEFSYGSLLDKLRINAPGKGRIRVFAVTTSAAGFGRSALCFLFPIIDDTRREEPRALVAITVDAGLDLLETLHRWPSNSATGEVIVVRREGDQAQYVVMPNRAKAGSVPSTIPLTDRKLPAVAALLEGDGQRQGVGHFGHVVESASVSLKSIDWVVVAKIDRAEILAGTVVRTRVLSIVIFGTILLAGLLVAVLWRNQRADIEGYGKEQEHARNLLNHHYQRMFRAARDSALLVRDDGVIADVNDAALAAYGYSASEMIGKHVRDLRPETAKAPFEEQWRIAGLEGGALFETQHRRKDGTVFPVEVGSAPFEVDGRKYRQSFIRDVSQRKTLEREIARLSRVKRALFEAADVVLHAASQSALYDDVCKSIVEFAGYRVAAIQKPVDDAEKSIRLMAAAGEGAEYVKQIRVSWNDGEHGQGPLGTSIRTGEIQINQDFVSNARMGPWRTLAARHGLGASICLPVRARGRVFCVLAIYAAEPNAFDFEEVELLRHLADDIGFGLERLHDKAEREKAEQELARLSRIQQALFQATSALLHATTEAQLLEDVCRVVTGRAGYRLASIGVPEKGPDKAVRFVAVVGEAADYLRKAKISWDDSAYGQGPTGSALRTGEPQVVQDFAGSSRLALWHELAGTYGLQSCVGLPLRSDDKVIAVLTIYSAEKNSFDSAELAMLERFAAELSFGVQAARQKEERNRFQQQVVRLSRFQKALLNAHGVMMRARTEAKLYDGICKVIVEDAGYLLAGVGLVQHDAVPPIRPVAVAGGGTHTTEILQLAMLRARAADGSGPVGLAVRSGQVQVIRHRSDDPTLEPWRPRLAALGVTIGATAALPLKRDGAVFGVLVVFSTLEYDFLDDEIAMLGSFADEIAFYVDILRRGGAPS